MESKTSNTKKAVVMGLEKTAITLKSQDLI